LPGAIVGYLIGGLYARVSYLWAAEYLPAFFAQHGYQFSGSLPLLVSLANFIRYNFVWYSALLSVVTLVTGAAYADKTLRATLSRFTDRSLDKLSA
jgi:hypothetical protein